MIFPRQILERVGLIVVRVARFPVGVIAGVPISLVLFVHDRTSVARALVSASPIILTTMTGFILNDLFDRRTDAMRGQLKPIANGDVPALWAAAAAVLMALSALAIAGIVARSYSVWVVVCALVGIAAYSPLARRFPVAKGLFTALLCCTPLMYASALSGYAFPAGYYVFLVLFIVGRELLLDVRDYQWDRLARIRTLAAVMSKRTSQVVGWLFMIVGTGGFVALSQGYSRLLFLSAALSLAAVLCLYLRDNQRALAWSRLTLLLATVAAAIGT